MKIKKLKKWEIVELFWVDSMLTSGWKFEDTANDLTDDKYLYHRSVGYFFKLTKQAICLAQSRSNDGEKESNVAEVIAIPRIAIKEIKYIKTK